MALSIWNNIDEQALYLGLKRLDGESNDELRNRVKLFSKWKYKTDYYTQVHSIPIQCGLETSRIVKIVNNAGNKFSCDIGWDWFILKETLADGSTGEYIRCFLEGKGDTIRTVVDKIGLSTSFSVLILDESKLDKRLEFLIRNSNVKITKVQLEAGEKFLGNSNIVKGTFISSSGLLLKEVNSVDDIKRRGEYYIDYKTGMLFTYETLSDGVTVSYNYYDESFCLEYTELNLIPVNRLFSYGMTDDSIAVIPYLMNSVIAGE